MRRISQHKDGNHDLIVAEYRKHGCPVLSLVKCGGGAPDLLVLIGGFPRLVEIKTAKGKLKDKQAEFAKWWPVMVVRTPDDVAAHVHSLTRAA